MKIAVLISKNVTQERVLIMVGLLVVTHGNFGEELVKSAELIIGKQDMVKAINLKPGDNIDLLSSAVNSAIKDLDDGSGVIVLTDLFGGSPSNAVASNMRRLHFKSITGINLPMLIECLTSRKTIAMDGLADLCYKAGRDGIINIEKFFTNK